MGLRLAICAVVAFFGLGVASAACAEHYASGNVIRCESRDYQQQYCAADTRAGVQLLRQVSRADCYEGETWGYDRRGIWVSEGCAADFEVGARSGYGRPYSAPAPQAFPGNRPEPRPGYGHSQNYGAGTVVCESEDHEYQYCSVRVRRDVELINQFSRSECEYGYSWGYDRDGIWVDHGCAAEFEVN